MRYAFIRDHRKEFRVRKMCEVLECIVSAKTGQIGLEVKTWFSRFGDSERSLS